MGAGRGARPARLCPRQPPTHLISGLLGPAGLPCFPPIVLIAPASALGAPHPSFHLLFENNLCQCPQPGPWRERRRRRRRRRQQPKCQGIGHAAGLCLGCPAAEAQSPGAGHVARRLAAQGRLCGRWAWAGLGWQRPPGTAWPTQAGGRPKPGRRVGSGWCSPWQPGWG